MIQTLKTIGLSILWFALTVVGIKIFALVLQWVLTEIGFGGFPVDELAGLLVLGAFFYFLISLIVGFIWPKPQV